MQQSWCKNLTIIDEHTMIAHFLERRRGREVEGTPLLREHLGKTWIEGSNPSVSAKRCKHSPSGLFLFVCLY